MGAAARAAPTRGGKTLFLHRRLRGTAVMFEPAAERDEQRSAVLQPGPASGEKLLLRAEQVAFGIQNFEVVGNALPIAQAGDASDPLLRRERAFERLDL